MTRCVTMHISNHNNCVVKCGVNMSNIKIRYSFARRLRVGFSQDFYLLILFYFSYLQSQQLYLASASIVFSHCPGLEVHDGNGYHGMNVPSSVWCSSCFTTKVTASTLIASLRRIASWSGVRSAIYEYLQKRLQQQDLRCWKSINTHKSMKCAFVAGMSAVNTSHFSFYLIMTLLCFGFAGPNYP